MKIAGFQKTSFVDYPGIISAVVFTPGCNMRCGYCHNKHILSGNVNLINELTVTEYLFKRKGMVSGVVVSGGEPTLQPDLERFISTVKAMGYRVKLDTNGTAPDVVKSLFEKGLIDYVAMDIKAPLEKYGDICRCYVDTDAVMKTVEYLQSNNVPHEFRTTFCPELSKEDILDISRNIIKNSDFYLQQYRQVEGEGLPHPRDHVLSAAEEVISAGGKCTVRGL